MKALVRNSTKPEDVTLNELAIPETYGTFLLAKVKYAGICASDLDILYHRNDIYKPPVVQGHEFSAVVEAVGQDVTGFTKGDLITSETTLEIMGVPDAHRLPDYQLMPGKEIVGWTRNGGFAQYVLVNSHFCHKFPSETDPRKVALCEPTAVAAETVVVRGKVKPSDVVVVIGPGPIGLLCALIAQEYTKSKQVWLIGLPDDNLVRLKVARQLGIQNSHSLDESLVDSLLSKNQGQLADVVIDATGSIKGYELALKLVRRKGKIVQAGSITSETTFSWEQAAYLVLELIFVFSSSREAWQIATKFINETRVDLNELITSEFPLEKYKQAFKAAQDTSKHIKVFFNPNIDGRS